MTVAMARRFSPSVQNYIKNLTLTIFNSINRCLGRVKLTIMALGRFVDAPKVVTLHIEVTKRV